MEGGWYATVQTPRIRTAEEFALELLDGCDVLVQPGYFYDFEQEALRSRSQRRTMKLHQRLDLEAFP